MLQWLSFELSDGDDGVSTLDAMASVREAGQLDALRAEAAQVLAWAWQCFPGRHGPVEDGGLWDHELLERSEPGGWTTLTLTFSAAPEFVDAFQAAWAEPGH